MAIDLKAYSRDEIVTMAGRYMTPNYRNAPLIFVDGQGPWGRTVDGQRYLDFSAGVAVNALGHNHPDLVAALEGQVGRLLHQSNYWHNAHMVPVAGLLCEHWAAAGGGEARAFFCNSGAEANEALIKLARRFHAVVGGRARPGIITAHDSFHGRTYAAMTATGQPKYQAGFEPLVPGFSHADFGDLASFEAAMDDDTGAVLIEVVQGEGGVIVPPEGFFSGLRKLCDERGVLLLLDEVQTGMGRTGTFFAFEQEGVVPDAVSLAKALGGGVPVGAILAGAEVAAALTPGSHATTFGGNALAMCAARAVLEIFARDDIVQRTAEIGAYLLAGLKDAFAGRSWVQDVRGRGLLVGVSVNGDARAVIAQARERGLLISVAGGCVLRMTPPLIVTREQCDLAVATLREAADEVLGRD